MRNGHIQFAKKELEGCKNNATRRQSGAYPTTASQGNNRRDTPLSGKEKGDTETRAAVTKGARTLPAVFIPTCSN